ncbi:MAG: ABC transporter ATP-binding protein [Burkholderiaceae bacterium]|jgi:ABC-type branched-subunit amino acid transport system ATPase component|nr:ABC transporter ATP-binding protein [Burkholderiaceae bacterium]
MSSAAGSVAAAGRVAPAVPPLLEAVGLVKHFGGVQAVDQVSFALMAGEFAALIGPNGAGKSTLFGLLCGQHRPSAGAVHVAGRRIDRLGAAQRAACGIGRTFQTAQSFATLSVRENLQLAIAARAGRVRDPWTPLRRLYADEADALLLQVGLAERAAHAAADLPYPDTKRLELAIALAGAPRLLLMDEPTAGMAAAERFALMDRVREIAADGQLTVLFTEHSMEVVFGYARRVLVMARGRLIVDGAPDDVRRDPAAQAAYFGDVRDDVRGDQSDDQRGDRRAERGQMPPQAGR